MQMTSEFFAVSLHILRPLSAVNKSVSTTVGLLMFILNNETKTSKKKISK